MEVAEATFCEASLDLARGHADPAIDGGDRLEHRGNVDPVAGHETQVVGADDPPGIPTDELIASGERDGQGVPSLLHSIEVRLETESLAEERQPALHATTGTTRGRARAPGMRRRPSMARPCPRASISPRAPSSCLRRIRNGPGSPASRVGSWVSRRSSRWWLTWSRPSPRSCRDCGGRCSAATSMTLPPNFRIAVPPLRTTVSSSNRRSCRSQSRKCSSANSR